MDMVSQKASAFVGYIAQRLRHENFVLIDIGCSGGLDWTWRSFGDRLNAWGFDPNNIPYRLTVRIPLLPSLC